MRKSMRVQYVKLPHNLNRFEYANVKQQFLFIAVMF